MTSANFSAAKSELSLIGANRSLLKRIYLRLMTDRREMEVVASFATQASAKARQPTRVIDIGCGYGRHLRRLKAGGFDVSGVDVNPELVASCQRSGFACFTPPEFDAHSGTYDIMLMSHVIEHFSPSECWKFIDRYLDRVAPEGHLIIATPLMSNNFYDDFDHVRPYQPLGLLMVFGEGAAQVQYYARNRLKLSDVWFRRGPWRINHCRARYLPGPANKLLLLMDMLLVLAFRISFGVLGRTDGWVGLFQKLRDPN